MIDRSVTFFSREGGLVVLRARVVHPPLVVRLLTCSVAIITRRNPLERM